MNELRAFDEIRYFSYLTESLADYTDDVLRIFAEYTSRKMERNLVDYDDLLRKRIIPVLAFVLLAAKTTSQLNDHLWTAWLGAALIVLAGLRGAGKRWMYFVLPPVASGLHGFPARTWRLSRPELT